MQITLHTSLIMMKVHFYLVFYGMLYLDILIMTSFIYQKRMVFFICLLFKGKWNNVMLVSFESIANNPFLIPLLKLVEKFHRFTMIFVTPCLFYFLMEIKIWWFSSIITLGHVGCTYWNINLKLLKLLRMLYLKYGSFHDVFQKLKLLFWANAILHAIYEKNRCPSHALKNKTPYEMWYGFIPSVRNHKVLVPPIMPWFLRNKEAILMKKSEVYLLGVFRYHQGISPLHQGKQEIYSFKICNFSWIFQD